MKKLLLIAGACFVFLLASCTATGTLGTIDKALGGTAYAATVPTTGAMTLDIAVHGTADAAPLAKDYIPAPWGSIIAIGLTTISAGLAAWQTARASTANTKLATATSVINAAAPGVAQLVSQVTDNQTLSSDITHLTQVAPGVINLLSHPAASGAVATLSALKAPVPASQPPASV